MTDVSISKLINNLWVLQLQKKEGLREHRHPAREGEGARWMRVMRKHDEADNGRVRESKANEPPEGLAFLCCCITRSKCFAAKDDFVNEGGGVAVCEGAEGGEAGLCNNYVGEFAGGDGAGDGGHVHCAGGIYGDGIEGLLGRQVHLDAAQGHDETHVAGR